MTLVAIVIDHVNRAAVFTILRHPQTHPSSHPMKTHALLYLTVNVELD